MGMTTHAFVVRGGTQEVEQIRLHVPEPEGHQVRFRILATGLCRSQLNQIADAAKQPADAARLLGHEAIAVVQDIGDQVTRVQPGDAVIVSWLPADVSREVRGVDLRADNGMPLYTPDIFTWTQIGMSDEAYLVPVPSTTLTTDHAIVGCAVITGAGAVKNSLAVRSEMSVAVIGVGGVGASAVMAAHKLGASKIFAADANETKLDYASTLGATHTVNLREEELYQVIATVCPGGVDAVVDCVAKPETIRAGMSALRSGKMGVSRGGSLALVGVAQAPIEIDVRQLQVEEQAIVGSFGGSSALDSDVREYLHWFDKQPNLLEKLVTERVSFDHIPEAVKSLEKGTVLGRCVAVVDETSVS